MVCCCPYLEFRPEEEYADFEYFRVDVEDMSREPIQLFFGEAVRFIHEWRQKEEAVYVHCRAGVSRSATIVLSYLIAKLHYSLHDAFFLVRSRRSIITPNLGFMEQLCEFEQSVVGPGAGAPGARGGPSIDMWKYTEWYTASGDRTGVPDLEPDY